ncbi:hypothetical protein OJ998_28770 [Solirubrobacter taibaiensis]|nr:hypothetical protein [Solirubrobacter taibaiensis]
MWRKTLPILSGAVLLGSLFVPWYGLAGAPLSLSLTAWGAFTVSDWALAVLAVVIAAAPPVRAVAAWIAVVLIAGRLLYPPMPELLEPAYGGFVGLAGALSAAWPGRLRAGEVVAGVGGFMLVLALGLEWYEFALTDAVGPNEQDPTEPVSTWISDSSGWSVFTRLDLALTALAALFLAVPVTRWRPVAIAAAAVGWLAIVLVAARMISPPDPITDVAAGAWIALAGAGVAWAGALLATRRPDPDVA